MTDDKKDEEIKRRPIMMSKKIMKVGGSKVIVIPPEWLEQHNLQEGDEVTLVANCDIRICAPDKSEKVYDQITDIVNEADTGSRKKSEKTDTEKKIT